MNLAKMPSSTVQILGAEKALFRALKAKQATPKYGLIYHATLVGQAKANHKGKVCALRQTQIHFCRQVKPESFLISEVALKKSSKRSLHLTFKRTETPGVLRSA